MSTSTSDPFDVVLKLVYSCNLHRAAPYQIQVLAYADDGSDEVVKTARLNDHLSEGRSSAFSMFCAPPWLTETSATSVTTPLSTVSTGHTVPVASSASSGDGDPATARLFKTVIRKIAVPDLDVPIHLFMVRRDVDPLRMYPYLIVVSRTSRALQKFTTILFSQIASRYPSLSLPTCFVFNESIGADEMSMWSPREGFNELVDWFLKFIDE